MDASTPSAELRSSTAPKSRTPLILLCLGQMLLQLDFSIVNIALPSMQRDLGFTPVALQWVVTGYALAFGSLLLFGGRLADVVGHRRMLMIGLVAFAITSFTGGFATSPAMLIVSRIGQGASAAMVSPAALAFLTSLYTTMESRAQALGLFQASTAAGATIGLVLGGVLTHFFGWRAVLLVNPPVIAILVVMMLKFLPVMQQPGKGRRLDLVGALLATASVSALVYGMNLGEQYGFTSILTAAMLAFAVVLLVAFVVNERLVKEPMLPLSIFHDRTRRGALVVLFMIGCVIASYVYFISMYMQKVLDFGALWTGLAMLPATLSVMTSSYFVGRRLVPKLGTRRVLCFSLPLLAVGQFWLSRMTADGTYLVTVLPGLLMSASAFGVTLSATALAITSGVPAEMRGVAGGLMVTAMQVGSAVGLSVLATIAAARSDMPGAGLVEGYSLSFLVGSCIVVAAALLAATLIKPKGSPV
jgi:EmrB/QacA subfamily drug resistance transporter